MLYRTLMFLSLIARMMPYGLLMAIGRVLGNIYYVFVKKQRRRAIAQMMPALGVDENEAKKLVRESFVNLAKNMLEILYMPNLNEKNVNDYLDIENLDRMRAALDEGHGVVILTGHIGTWEWLSAAFTLNNMPASAIAKQQPNADYTKALNELRSKINMEIFSRGTSELLMAAKALKSGKILGFLADQDAGPGGAFIDFLGKKASTPLGPAVFSRKYDAPILPCFILRQKNGKHKVLIGEAMRYVDTGDTDKDLFDLTVKMTKILENVIRENPTQWIWFQKRWNTEEAQKKIKHHTVRSKEEAKK